MSEFRPYLISFLLLGILAMAVINIGIFIADDNHATQSIANDTVISSYSESLKSNLENASDSAAGADTSFRNSSISTTGGVVLIDAIGGLWTTLSTTPLAVSRLTINLVKDKILGDTAFYAIFGVITLIVVVTLILAVVKLVTQGEGG